MPKVTPLSVMNNPVAKKAMAQQSRVAIARSIKAEVDSEEVELEKIESALTATYAKFDASAQKPLQASQIRTASIALKKVSAGLQKRENAATLRLARALYHNMKTDKIIGQVEAIAALKVKARMLHAQTIASIASSESDLETQIDDTLVPVDENGYVAPATAGEDDLTDPADLTDPTFASDGEDLFLDDDENALAAALAEDTPLDDPLNSLAATAELDDYLDEGNFEDNRVTEEGTTPLPTTASIHKRASAVPRTQARQATAAVNEADILKQAIVESM